MATSQHQVATERDPAIEPLACLALLTGAVASVVVFAPAEGRILAPVHEAVAALLGQASFVLPLGLLFVGVLLGIRRVRPFVALPTRRLTGVALLAVAVLPAERLLGYSTGLLGDWLAGFLLEVFGPAVTVLVTLAVVVVGATLALDVRLPRRRHVATS
jgi:4TM region of DNA translocase FtsK/SpoIIIE